MKIDSSPSLGAPLSFVWSETSAFSLCLCSADSVKVKWDEIWILNLYWLVSPESWAACLNEQVRWEERRPEELREWRRRITYVHGNVPGHVDMRLVFIHPHFGGPQGIPLGVVIYVVVVGFLGALDVRHSGTWQDFHASSALPHLESRKRMSLSFCWVFLCTKTSILNILNTD